MGDVYALFLHALILPQNGCRHAAMGLLASLSEQTVLNIFTP